MATHLPHHIVHLYDIDRVSRIDGYITRFRGNCTAKLHTNNNAQTKDIDVHNKSLNKI